ncbi:MAG: CehA/McbA family metallohydrolase, partial [Clostridia bacterium]|nr:CehA/McbA family metallohydrolase [Clostridia bacterium]
MNLFEDGMPFFKGNLHCHTTVSDGALSPENVVGLYQGLGYDLLAITDHRYFSGASRFARGMLLLAGIEIDCDLPREALHIIGIGMGAEYAHRKNQRLDPQSCIDEIRQHGGCAIVAHPAWSLNTLETLTGLRHTTAAEIYNSFSTFPWNGDRADSSLLLDLAATHGAPYNVVASDDSHRYKGEEGRSFTMIQAEALTAKDIIQALREGRFYASQGPRFEQIILEEDRVCICCSPVETVFFYSNIPRAYGRFVTVPLQSEAEYSLRTPPGAMCPCCLII